MDWLSRSMMGMAVADPRAQVVLSNVMEYPNRSYYLFLTKQAAHFYLSGGDEDE